MTSSTNNGTDATSSMANWASALITLFLNQLLSLAVVTFFAIGLITESSRAIAAIELAVPKMTQFYIDLGTRGVLGGVLISLVVSAGCFAFRRHVLSVVGMSCSFVAALVFLGLGVFYTVAPLLVAFRNLLPMSAKW